MQPRYGRFTVRMECPQCGIPVPLDGPKESISCTNCLSEITIQAALWVQILEGCFDSGHQHVKDGATHVQTLEINGLRVRVEICKTLPSCEVCNSPYPVEHLGTGVEQNFSCTQCGDPASTFPAPDWLKSLVDTAVQIYHTAPRPLHGTSIDPSNAIQPVALTCPTCSGSLSAGTDSERIMPCTYCGSEVYLPDAIWRRLHPVKVAEAFFLRFEGMNRWDHEQQANRDRDAAAQQAAGEKASRGAAARQRQSEAGRQAQDATERLYAQVGRTKQMRAWIAAFVALGAIAAVVSYWSTLDKDVLENVANFHWTVQGSILGIVLVFYIAMKFASSTLRHAARKDTSWGFNKVTVWLLFSLFLPPIGVWRVITLWRGRFRKSSSTTSHGHGPGTTTYYTAVHVKGGEGRPTALLLLPLIFCGSVHFMDGYASLIDFVVPDEFRQSAQHQQRRSANVIEAHTLRRLIPGYSIEDGSAEHYFDASGLVLSIDGKKRTVGRWTLRGDKVCMETVLTDVKCSTWAAPTQATPSNHRRLKVRTSDRYKACAKGKVESCESLRLILRDVDKPNYNKLSEMGCTAGNADMCLDAGRESTGKKARGLLVKACDLNLTKACEELATTSKRARSRLKYAKKACELDSARCGLYVENLMSTGKSKQALLASGPACENSSLSSCIAHSTLLSRKGRFTEAEDSAKKALALSPDSAAAHIALGNARMLLSDSPAAQQSYKTALEGGPHPARVRAELMHLRKNQKKHRSAIDALLHGPLMQK